MALYGSTDYEEKAHSDLEIIGQGLEPALGDPSKAPEAFTRIQDIGPHINPVSSQREDSNVNPVIALRFSYLCLFFIQKLVFVFLPFKKEYY